MTTDFRALCAELVDDLELCDWPYKLKEAIRADINRARAALSQPEPEVVEPSLEEVEDLCEEHRFNVRGYESIECLQELINDALARWGRPAQAAPVPVAVTGWQPISTAPKDGTEILVSDYDAIEIVSWKIYEAGSGWESRWGEVMFPSWWQCAHA